jgi:hypothetical protein
MLKYVLSITTEFGLLASVHKIEWLATDSIVLRFDSIPVFKTPLFKHLDIALSLKLCGNRSQETS